MKDSPRERQAINACIGWIVFVVILGALAILALSLCTPPSFAQDQETARFLTLLNAYRTKGGLNNLVEDSRLVAASEWMAGDMIAHCVLTGPTCEHTDSLGRGPGERIQSFGYPDRAGESMGENIAWDGAVRTADQVMAAWQDSAPHNANMLNPAWKAAGISRRCTTEHCAWVNDFGSEFPRSVPTFTPAPTPRVPPTPEPTIPSIYPVLPTSTPTPVVPEPGTLVLFASGASVVLWASRKMRQ
jgi:hypothetical protein